jgi:hypothetical protein
MAKDVIARLKADTSQWDSGLAKATRSLNKFQQDNMSLDAALQGSVKTITSVAAKYVGWGAAAAGAMKVAKDAFKRNEAQLDEWQGFVRASESVYGGFLEALNNGDISGYLSNINSIIDAARNAYDALDELGTFQAFNQVNSARDKANYQEALDNYRLNPTDDNKKALEAANQKVIQNLKDESLLAQDAYKTALEAAAAEGGLRGEDVNTFVKMFQDGAYRDFKKLKERYKEEGGILGVGGKTMFDGEEVTSVNGRGYWKKQGTAMHNGQQVNIGIQDMSKAENSAFLVARSLYNITDDTINQLQRLGADAYNLEEAVNQQNRSYHRLSGQNKTITPKTTKSSKTFKSDISGLSDIPGLSFGATKSMKELNAELARYKKMKEEATTSFEYNEAIEGIEQVQKEIAVQPITLQLGVDAEKIVSIQEIINNFFKDHPITPEMKLPTGNFQSVSKISQDTADAWQAATRAISNAGNAMTNLEDPSAKVAGIVMQAIANIALGFAQASASPATGLAGVFGWIAAVTAGVATMTATIAQIKSATEYHAQGGMVGTSTFIPKGTDTVPAMLTPGEIVLNAAQQRNMANNLQGTSNIVMQSSGESRISGEDIITVINAYGRRTGRGEILV